MRARRLFRHQITSGYSWLLISGPSDRHLCMTCFHEAVFGVDAQKEIEVIALREHSS